MCWLGVLHSTRWLTALRSKETGAAPTAQSSGGAGSNMYEDSIKEGDLWKYEPKTGWQKLYCVLLPEVFLAYTDRAAVRQPLLSFAVTVWCGMTLT
jgi:hypothetical protein